MAKSKSNRKPKPGKGRKVRVEFRRNRTKPPRDRNLTSEVLNADGHETDQVDRERVVAKGELSRRRTVTVYDNVEDLPAGTLAGVAVAVRGLYVDVDDGRQIRSCTVRRVLRTTRIAGRGAVAVGDRVHFRPEECDGAGDEGVIIYVEPRRSELRRRSGRRIHTIAANVDVVVAVSSAHQPTPKPHLIDRYIVASLAGRMTPVLCMNKIDLDADGSARELLNRYADLGYRTLCTSVVTGDGIDELRAVLKGRASVITGQSGVGKSSLLNMVQPGLGLKVGDIVEHVQKGRHTTVTASVLRLEIGGYVVDTPGIRSFDLTVIDPCEIEAHFVDLLPHIPHCKFPDCTHRHETNCAVKRAVADGSIRTERYESYVRMFEDPGGERINF